MNAPAPTSLTAAYFYKVRWGYHDEWVELFRRNRRVPGEIRLSVKGLHREGVFSDITFDVRAGEVLGFAGLVGAGPDRHDRHRGPVPP